MQLLNFDQNSNFLLLKISKNYAKCVSEVCEWGTSPYSNLKTSLNRSCFNVNSIIASDSALQIEYFLYNWRFDLNGYKFEHQFINVVSGIQPKLKMFLFCRCLAPKDFYFVAKVTTAQSQDAQTASRSLPLAFFSRVLK